MPLTAPKGLKTRTKITRTKVVSTKIPKSKAKVGNLQTHGKVKLGKGKGVKRVISRGDSTNFA